MPMGSGLGISSIGFAYLGGPGNIIPGGNTAPQPYISTAVQFPIVGSSLTYLFQNSSPLNDSQTLSFSVWLQAPAASNFGLFNSGFSGSTNRSGINIQVLNNQINIRVGCTDDIGGSFSYIQWTWNVSLGANWHHLFFSTDKTNPGSPLVNLYLDGMPQTQFGQIDVATSNPIGVNGLAVGVPGLPQGTYFNGTLGASSPAVSLSNMQVWIGTYIDPTITYGSGTLFNPASTYPAQGETQGPNAVTMGELVLAMVAAGVDPTFALTVSNIENGYLPSYNNSASRGGLFDFEPGEITFVIGQNLGPYGFTGNSNQITAFISYNFNLWSTTALAQFPSGDPTGVYRYTVHNQGPTGANWIWNHRSSTIASAPGGLTPPPNAGIGYDMMNQTWAKNGRWGNLTLDPFVNTAQDWMNNLQTVWNLASGDAAARLMSVTNQNINAFITLTGLPVPPNTAAQLFGLPDIQFNGDSSANGFQKNSYDGGPFLLLNGPLLDVPGPP